MLGGAEGLNLLRPGVLALSALLISSAASGQGVPFIGIVVPEKVGIRCGAGTKHYVCGHLQAGSLVRVEQIIFGWYKILSPWDAYNFIAKAFVDARGDGSDGVVNQNRSPVKAVNLENKGNSYRTLVSLVKNMRVKIYGEYGSYYMISPPPRSYVYVPASTIRRATREEIRHAAARSKSAAPYTESPNAGRPPADPRPKPRESSTMSDGQTDLEARVRAPVGTTVETMVIEPREPTLTDAVMSRRKLDQPTTVWLPEHPRLTAPAIALADKQPAMVAVPEQPKAAQAAPPTAVADIVIMPESIPEMDVSDHATPLLPENAPPLSAEGMLRGADQRFAQISQQLLEQQPLDQMAKMYVAIEQRGQLGPEQVKHVKARIAVLRRRTVLAGVLGGIVEARRRHELFIKSEQTKPAPMDVVGRLLASELYDGTTLPRLFRLVDPATRRTLAYVRPGGASDPEPYLGRLVAVTGPTRWDEGLNLRIVNPRGIEVLRTASP